MNCCFLDSLGFDVECANHFVDRGRHGRTFRLSEVAIDSFLRQSPTVIASRSCSRQERSIILVAIAGNWHDLSRKQVASALACNQVSDSKNEGAIAATMAPRSKLQAYRPPIAMNKAITIPTTATTTSNPSQSLTFGGR